MRRTVCPKNRRCNLSQKMNQTHNKLSLKATWTLQAVISENYDQICPLDFSHMLQRR